MKKHFFLSLLLVSVVCGAHAQSYQVTENSYQRIGITITPSKLQALNIKTTQGNFARIMMDECTPSRQIGEPELPVMVKLLEIPLCDSLILSVSNAQYEEYEAATLGVDYELYPAQPAYPKSYKGQIDFVKDTATYLTDAFYANSLVNIEKLGIMRDVNLAKISVSPVSYNPVSKKIRIYTYVEVEITFHNVDIPGTLEMKSKYGSPLFDATSGNVINPVSGRERDEINAAPIKYLVIAHSMFANDNDLNSFVNWKKRMGYVVEIAYTNTTGTSTTSIKNYIQAEYDNATPDNPAPTYLLLIGDVAQIPAWPGTASDGGHVTDLYYATLTSGDNLPDCYYGRFSAQNVNQLVPQIQKTLMYEQYTMPDPSYLNKAVLIAGTDYYHAPTHGNGQVNYIHNNYINTSHNYTNVYTHLYNCSNQAATIRNEIGAGVGWTNYTAHGNWDCWADPEFNNDQVSQMNNADKYGLMIGNCCLSGEFDKNACFGETLMRAANKGALAYIGASNSSYWDEDYYWAVGIRSSITANPTYNASNLGAYDRIFHTHNEAHDEWYTTTSGLIYAGNLAVEASTTDLGNYYWEIYHVFGDPAIKLYLGVPSVMTVSASDAIVIGTTSYQVHAVPYAYVALTHDNELIAAAFADASGDATLVFDNVIEQGTYELAVSAQNYIQYFKDISVIAPSGSYVVATSVNMTTNSVPTTASTVQWDITLTNLGVAAASNVSAKISSSHAGVSFAQDSVYAGNLAVDASTTFPGAFIATLPADVVDQDIVPFVVTVHFDAGTSSHNFNMTILAPKIEVTEFTAVNANGSSTLSAGDSVTLTITNHNSGHLNLDSALTQLTSHYTGAIVTSGAQTISSLSANASDSTIFTIQIRDFVNEVSIIPLYYHTWIGSVHQVDTLYITIGNALETWENNNFTTFNWSNNSSNKWIIVNSGAYAGNYCARSAMNLAHNTNSTLQISMTTSRNGNFSYYRKVSSEASYDKLKVYIDGQVKEELSGNVPWEQASFPVSAGTHTYKFTYSKDYSVSYGSDCAWIDNIVFPGLGTMVTEDTTDDVGINYYANDLQAIVYPNPTYHQITVSSPIPIRQICVFDLGGRIIKQLEIGAAQTITLNVASWARGIYFVKSIFTDGRTSTAKFIKQ